MDIWGWLRSLGLERYEGAFRENAIAGDVLRDLTDQDLEKLGVLLGDVVKDYSRTVMMSASDFDSRTVERLFSKLSQVAIRDLSSEGFKRDRIKLARSVAVRYVGQSFEIDVAWGSRFEAAFHAAHRERYGYGDRSRAIEIVSLRLRATGVTHKPRLKRRPSTRTHHPKPLNQAHVYLSERPVKVAVYSRDDLAAGARINGPAIITEYSSTTLIPPRFKVEVDSWLNLVMG